MCLHSLKKPLVRLWRSIQACQELTICLGADCKNCTIQKRVFGRTAGSVQNEIRAVLASEVRRTINQLADLGFDAKIERFALTGVTLCASHIGLLSKG